MVGLNLNERPSTSPGMWTLPLLHQMSGQQVSVQTVNHQFLSLRVRIRHSGLQTLVKNKYPSAHLIHCYSYRLNLVLSKSCCSIKECNAFKQLESIPSFFSHSKVRTEILSNLIMKKLPD